MRESRKGWRHPVSVPMVNRHTGEIDFDVTLFGLTLEEAMCIPCPEIQALAERYPNYTSSPFMLYAAR